MKTDLNRPSIHLFSPSSDIRMQSVAVPGLGARIDAPIEPKVAALGPWARLQQKLGPSELRRRLWHIAPGFLPLILWPIPHEDPLSATLKTIMIVLAVVISVAAYFKHRSFRRRGEKSLVPAVFGYAGIVLATLILVPASPELGLSVMAILAFGDGSATLVGLLAGGPRLSWNPAKSWAGLASFLAFSIPAATLVYWGEAQPHVSLPIALCCAAPAAVIAAIAESLPSKINDNIRVGLAAAVTILMTHAMFVAR